MSTSFAYSVVAACALLISLLLKRGSVMTLLIMAEALWSLFLIITAVITLYGHGAGFMVFVFFVLCFSAAELANIVVGMAHANNISAIV